VLGVDGRVHGATRAGGSHASSTYPHGQGTLWAVSLDGTYESLHDFAGGEDGRQPTGDLALAPQGAIVGIVRRDFDQEAIFHLGPRGLRVTTSWYVGDPVGGGSATAGHAVAKDGTLYGTTVAFSTYGHGALFRVRPGGRPEVIHAFGDTSVDGQRGDSTPLLLSGNVLVGPTHFGGTSGVGAGYLVELAPASGRPR